MLVTETFAALCSLSRRCESFVSGIVASVIPVSTAVLSFTCSLEAVTMVFLDYEKQRILYYWCLGERDLTV